MIELEGQRISITRELLTEIQDLAYLFFPKYCSACGKFFADVEIYAEMAEIEISKADAVFNTGGGCHTITLYSHCPCGEKLSDTFSSRKDLTRTGEKRRAAFQDVMVRIYHMGVTMAASRTELLGLMRGIESHILNVKCLDQPRG
jgi:hypothetical protein